MILLIYLQNCPFNGVSKEIMTISMMFKQIKVTGCIKLTILS